MASRRNTVLIEIHEDAYKQNSVYRPWVEVKAAGSVKKSGPSRQSGQTQRRYDALRPRIATALTNG